VTRGRLPQRAGLPSLNGGGSGIVVPPLSQRTRIYCAQVKYNYVNRRNIQPKFMRGSTGISGTAVDLTETSAVEAMFINRQTDRQTDGELDRVCRTTI